MEVECVEYWGSLNDSNFTWVIFKKFRSKYIYTLNSTQCAQIARAAIKQLLSGFLKGMGVPTNLIKNPWLITFWLIFWTLFTIVLFCKWKHSIKLSRFTRQCKMNIQNCHVCRHCHVRCHINWFQDFHLMPYLNPHFLLVKYWKKWGPLYYETLQVYQAQRVW